MTTFQFLFIHSILSVPSHAGQETIAQNSRLQNSPRNTIWATLLPVTFTKPNMTITCRNCTNSWAINDIFEVQYQSYLSSYVGTHFSIPGFCFNGISTFYIEVRVPSLKKINFLIVLQFKNEDEEVITILSLVVEFILH